MDPGDPIHNEHRAVRKVYATLIENAKRERWEGFLVSLDEKSIWVAHQYTSGDPTDRGRARIPPLRPCQEGGNIDLPQVAETNEDKGRQHFSQTSRVKTQARQMIAIPCPSLHSPQ